MIKIMEEEMTNEQPLDYPEQDDGITEDLYDEDLPETDTKPFGEFNAQETFATFGLPLKVDDVIDMNYPLI